jgi:hypothetical protein
MQQNANNKNKKINKKSPFVVPDWNFGLFVCKLFMIFRRISSSSMLE